jgi:hypothetical protein
VSDYLEGGIDGLSVEPGEQNGPPGGGQEDLRGAVCLGDEGGQVMERSAYTNCNMGKGGWTTRRRKLSPARGLTGQLIQSSQLSLLGHPVFS